GRRDTLRTKLTYSIQDYKDVAVLPPHEQATPDTENLSAPKIYPLSKPRLYHSYHQEKPRQLDPCDEDAFPKRIARTIRSYSTAPVPRAAPEQVPSSG